MSRRREKLVAQYIESMSRRILEEYQDLVREYVRGQHGLYALYRRDKLYYVGLASNLRSRLRAHLRDRHAGGWDRFSLYLTQTGDHLRELEALLLRIGMPKGNRSKTRLSHAEDLRRAFRHRIRESQKKELDDMFGKSMSSRSHSRTHGRKAKPARLADLLDGRLPIQMHYKGQVYRAIARQDGTVCLNRRVFTSLSLAAASIAGRPINGWWAWRYEAAPGEWLRLDRLRH